MNLLSTPLIPHSWGEKEELRDTLRLPAGGVLHFLPPRKGGKISSTLMREDKGEGEMPPNPRQGFVLEVPSVSKVGRLYQKHPN